MRGATIVAVGLLAALWAPGSAGAAGTFGIGAGSAPGVAVDAAGTAYIAWNGPEAVSTLQFCRLPRGASACAPRASIAGVPGTADGRAFVFVSGPRVIVVSSRFGSGRATYAFTSLDGGRTFGGGEVIGNVAFNEAIAGPGDTVSGTSAISGMRFQNAGIGGATSAFAELSTDHLYGGALGLLDGGAPLVVFNHGVTGAQQYRRHVGGDLNDAASWTPAVGIGTGYFPSIAYGKKGLYLLSGSGTGPISVRKYSGAGFGAPVRLKNGNASTTNLFQDPAGRLHAVHVTDSPRALVHSISDNGTTWRTSTLTGSVGTTLKDTRVAAGADHTGVAAWTQGRSGGSTEIRVARLAAGGAGTTAAQPRRRVAPEGTYTLGGVPRCLRTGSTLRATLTFQRKIGGVKLRRVDFLYKARRVKRATRAPYRATIKVGTVKAGRRYTISVRIVGTFRGRTHSRTIDARTPGC
jgi:hypothetical protein